MLPPEAAAAAAWAAFFAAFFCNAFPSLNKLKIKIIKTFEQPKPNSIKNLMFRTFHGVAQASIRRQHSFPFLQHELQLFHGHALSNFHVQFRIKSIIALIKETQKSFRFIISESYKI